MAIDFLRPDWPAPAKVKALQTMRSGGISEGCYASLNLGDHVDDHLPVVARNRKLLSEFLPAEPLWLQQVHGTAVAEVGTSMPGCSADASVAKRPDQVCAIMTADCLPVLLCDHAGTVVAAAHAGWRGLCDGVLEASVAAMGISGTQLMAWLGPAIGPDAFEVGAEVKAAFVKHEARATQAFAESPKNEGRWMANLYLLARQRLENMGIDQVYGGDFCTYQDPARFFSYRRDGVTGRMGTFIWLEGV